MHFFLYPQKKKKLYSNDLVQEIQSDDSSHDFQLVRLRRRKK